MGLSDILHRILKRQPYSKSQLEKLGARIGDNVFVGANAIILPNVKIGSNVIIGAGNVVVNIKKTV